MAQSRPIIKYKHPISGKTYACNFAISPEAALFELQRKAEADYQRSLPPEIRAKHTDDDFKCPKCHSKNKPVSRKEVITTGFFIFISTRIIDIFNCLDCHCDFTDRELYRERDEIRQENWRNLCFEKFKDKEITEEQFISAVTPQ